VKIAPQSRSSVALEGSVSIGSDFEEQPHSSLSTEGPHLLNQNDLSDLVRDLELTK